MAVRLRLEFPDDPLMRAGHETLYAWVYRQTADGTRDLRAYLPRGHRRRRALGVGHGDRRRGHAPVHQHAGRTQDPFPDRHAGRFEGGGRGQDRPHMGQRQRVRAPPAGRRVDGHAGLLRGPVQLVPAGQQREPQRHDPPLPAQGHEPGRPGPGRARRDHPADQQHAPEGSRMAHAGGGVGRADGTTRRPGHTRSRVLRTINPKPQHKAMLHFKLENGYLSAVVEG